MDPSDLTDLEPAPMRLPRSVVVIIVLFWLAQVALLTAQRLSILPDERIDLLVPRVVVALGAIGLSFLIAWVQLRLRRHSVQYRATVAVVLAAAATPIHAVINYYVFRILDGGPQSQMMDMILWLPALFLWFWVYAASSGLIYALLANAEVRERERRIVDLIRVANDAQLRALRYQLNPHFMFNTLNSVAALISTGRAGDAETMVENLSDFLRAGLSLDPLADVTLAREIELQSLYLAIEQVRFADRLVVRTEIEHAAAGALVPALVTQPLIENAIRHTVQATSDRAEIVIAASVRDDELHYSVTNDVPANAPARSGTGVGLVNVANRLRLRFDGRARFYHGPLADNRYSVSFVVPVTRLHAQ
jgi:hypothetical protein